MKAIKILLIISMLALPVVSASAKTNGKQTVTRSQITSLVREFRHNDGVDVVNLGRMATSLLSGIARLGALADQDEDVKAIAKAAKGIDALIVMDFEDADERVRRNIRTKIECLMAGSEILMEAKDDGDSMQIFGTSSKDGSKISDLIMYSSSDCALICLFGTISAESLADIVN